MGERITSIKADNAHGGEASGVRSLLAGPMVVLDGATLNPGDNPWDDLAALGPLKVHERTSRDLVLERSQDAEILLTNKTVLDREILERLPRLRLICVLATGVNVVDLTAAASAGITVCNVPGYASESVAQHVFALLLQRSNAVAEHALAVRGGEWAGAKDFSFWKTELTELAGLTMGIVGYGAIGAAVGRIAHAFGMEVLAVGRIPARKAPFDRFSWVSMEDLFARSDVVSLHCPSTPQNIGFVNAELLATMREGSVLVNTARGNLIDEKALAVALDRGRPAAAALDVLQQEPPPSNHPLIAHPRCLVTPHLAWATLAARRRLMAVTVENVRGFLCGRAQNVVVPDRKTNI